MEQGHSAEPAPINFRFMSEHRYTTGERRTHLIALELSLERLLAAIRETRQCLEYVPQFEEALLRTRELVAVPFDQEALTALAGVIPKLFYRHPHWVPPSEIGPNGQHRIISLVHEPGAARPSSHAMCRTVESCRILLILVWSLDLQACMHKSSMHGYQPMNLVRVKRPAKPPKPVPAKP